MRGRPNSGSTKVSMSLIPRTCDYVTIHGKRNFADVILDLKTVILSHIICVGLMQSLGTL